MLTSYSTFMSQIWMDGGVRGQKATAITLSAAHYSQSPLKGRSVSHGGPEWLFFIRYGQPLN